MPKVSQMPPPAAVRTRRAYFDCKFGQLHVRTAFPTTGGFDEQVTLFCLHPADASSRVFSRFLPQLADARSVYAPDLPGYGESDSSPARSAVDAAAAVADLARDLRLRQIDLLGAGEYGTAAAVELAIDKSELVRRVVLLGAPAVRWSALRQPRLALEPSELGDRPLEAALDPLARRIDLFLRGRS